MTFRAAVRATIGLEQLKHKTKIDKIMNKLIITIMGLLATFAAIPTVPAQNYNIPWYNIGPAGTSAGGGYSVSGTIGQPDAGTMTGGNYAVTGGFWSLFAVQTPGAPRLTITPAGPAQATISWTPNTAGYVLQSTDSLSPTNWINAPSGANNPVTVPVNVPARFYRLFHP